MIRRKIAFWVAAVAVVLLAVFRIEELPFLPYINVLGMDAATLRMVLFADVAVIVLILFLSRKDTTVRPNTAWSTPCGWIATFSGAVMALTAVADLFSLQTMLDPTQVPTALDYTLVGCVILFEVLGGLYLVLLGFRWMSGKSADSTALKWMSICPALWMWLRLARYEISYASTIDISESFFDFATLVFASLFFLQFARAMSGIGKNPKNSLPVMALCTAMVSISSIPVTISHLVVTNNVSNLSIHDLMTVIVDGVIGLMALVFVAMQIFSKADVPQEVLNEESDDASTAWNDPEKEYDPLDPPFSPDQLLPQFENFEPLAPVKASENEAEEPAAPVVAEELVEVQPVAQPTTEVAPSIDDLLAEIEDEQSTLQ